MSLVRVSMNLGGWEGAPGVNVYHFECDNIGHAWEELTEQIRDLLHAAYDGVKTFLISGLTAQCSSEFLEIEPDTGDLLEVHTVAPITPITGTASNTTNSRATMALVRHKTDLVFEGKRVNGRSYIGPIGGNALQAGGHLQTTAQNAFSAMFDGMQDIAGDTRLMVYHRPREATEDRPASIGKAGHVQSSDCWTLPGVLRSRRD